MNAFWSAVAGSALITLVHRSSFLVVASRFGEISPRLRTILSMVPAAALGALALPTLLVIDRELTLAPDRIVAGLAVLLVAWRTQSFLLSLAVGFGTLIGVGLLLG